jgi:zinc transport system permease protein
VLWAIAASLLATLVFVANPVHLHLTRESLLGFVFLLERRAAPSSSASRITQEAHDLAAILFGSAVVVQPDRSGPGRDGDGRPAGRARVLWRRAAVRRLRPDGRARAGDAGARAERRSCSCRSACPVALCTRALGALPVFAFSVLPAMTALALTARIGLVFLLATLVGALSGVAGYVVSFKGDLPVAPPRPPPRPALLAPRWSGASPRARYERRGRTS